jgi:hypothetical protein
MIKTAGNEVFEQSVERVRASLIARGVEGASTADERELGIMAFAAAMGISRGSAAMLLDAGFARAQRGQPVRQPAAEASNPVRASSCARQCSQPRK